MGNSVAIIGCGNIGLSLLQGLLRNSGADPSKITVTRRNTDELEYLREYGVVVTSDNKQAVQNSDIVVIAVKPYNLTSILDEIRESIDPARHILVSVTAGVTIKEISAQINISLPVFRAMPNISASVGRSVSCIAHGETQRREIDSVRQLFDNMGTTMVIDEELMQSATILGACGVAYVLRFIRAMIQGGIQIGFDAKTASEIVTRTVKGAAELLIEKQIHPESEIDKVTTPKGCTIVGLNEMEHNGFSSSLIKGIVASYEKIEK
ncbi:MAG TPA: pyrroline-5-carboxylate reductase [Bacteroidales bacterium]|nr:pyrroline-5-carboxylate reductase [Bacteroidales bacterium]